MKSLIIVGAGGYGREIASLSKDCIGYGKNFYLKGFLDQNPKALSNYYDYPPILGNETSYNPETDDVFVIAIANISSKMKCHSTLSRKGNTFLTLIHQSAVICQGAHIGDGCVIGRDCIISNDAKIGDHTTFNSKAMVGHDVYIGDYCNINAGAFFGGGAIVKSECTIHTYAIITPNIIVEHRAVVGAGSVVIKNVPEGKTVFGNPAKVIF